MAAEDTQVTCGAWRSQPFADGRCHAADDLTRQRPGQAGHPLEADLRYLDRLRHRGVTATNRVTRIQWPACPRVDRLGPPAPECLVLGPPHPVRVGRGPPFTTRRS